ncbi:MAG: hypothetical protein GX802_01120 [Clostridiales bacterium]|nr:hypothetical protein [Clostridiales bacterium]
MKKFLVVFLVILTVLSMYSCATKVSEPEPTINYLDENGLSIIDKAEYEFVERLAEPEIIAPESGLSGTESFLMASYFVFGKIVDVQELKVTHHYLKSNEDANDSVNYCTVITFEVQKSYGDKEIAGTQIKIADKRSSHSWHENNVPVVGDECFYLLRDANVWWEFFGRLPDSEQYVSYVVVNSAFMVITKEDTMYRAGVFVNYLLNDKKPEDEEPTKDLYTLAEVEEIITPYVLTMQGLSPMDILDMKKTDS